MSQILSQADESLPANKLGAWGRSVNCLRPLGCLLGQKDSPVTCTLTNVIAAGSPAVGAQGALGCSPN